MRNPAKILAGAAMSFAVTGAAAEPVFDGKDRVQAFIGVTEIEDQTGTLQNEVGEPVDIDFANLFTLGIEVETPLRSRGEGFEWGVNTGGGFGWKGSDTRFAGRVSDGQGTIAFRVDNEMLLLEGHIGPYFRVHLGKSVDFYAGGGPAIIYDLGAGKQWGIGVRYLGGEMEFNDTVGEFDLEALQLLITYSAWF